MMTVFNEARRWEKKLCLSLYEILSVSPDEASRLALPFGKETRVGIAADLDTEQNKMSAFPSLSPLYTPNPSFTQ
jgi:hypothetical protein